MIEHESYQNASKEKDSILEEKKLVIKSLTLEWDSLVKGENPENSISKEFEPEEDTEVRHKMN